MASELTAGQVLKSIRIKKGMTQKQLAQRVGISEGTISRIENEREMPHPNTIEAIIHVLDLDERTSLDLSNALVQPFSTSLEQPNLNIPKVSVKSFRGRAAEIDQIKSWANDKSENALTIMVISGIPGIGKSTLVARILLEKEIARSFVQRIWIRVADMSPQGIWLTLAENLQIDPTETNNLRIGVLRKLRDRGCLIVLDDVEQRIDLSDWILDRCDKSRIIVTTFMSDLVPARLSSQIYTLAIDRLTTDASESILVDGIQAVDPNEKERLLKIFDGLPLALELANSLARLDGHFKWLIQQVQENAVQTLGITNPIRKQDSLRLVFDAAYQRLSKMDQELFAFLSIFEPPFDVETLQAVTGWNTREIVQALRSLQSSNLLQRTKQHYTIHNLLHQYAGEIAGEKYSIKIIDLEVQFAEHFLGVGRKAAKEWGDGDEVSAVRVWRENLASISLGCRYAAKHHRWDWLVEYLACNAIYAGMMQRIDVLQAWQTLLEDSNLPILEKASGTVSIADGFAQANRWPEVIILTEKALQVSEVREADLLWLTASLFAAQGYLDQGNIPFVNKIIHDPRFLKLYHETDLPPFIKLQASFTYAKTLRLLGDFDQALYWQEKTLSLLQSSNYHLSNLTHTAILYEIGQIYFAFDKYEHALEVFQTGVRLSEETQTAIWAHTLLMSAWALTKLGQVDEAEQNLARIEEFEHDYDPYLEKMILFVRADIAWGNGSHDTARLLYRKAIAALGDSVLAINGLFMLAMRMQEIGRSQETEQIYREVMAKAEKIGYTSAYVDAGLCVAGLITSKDSQQAQQIYEKVIQNAMTAQLYAAASEAYHALGREQEADELNALHEVRKSVYRLPIHGGAFGRMVSTLFLYTDGDQNREDAAEGFLTHYAHKITKTAQWLNANGAHTQI